MAETFSGTFSIAITDDSQQYADFLIDKINKYAEKNSILLSVEHYSSPVAFFDAFSTNKINAYDAIILDVQMPDISGIELAQKIRFINKDIPIVFISDFPQFAVEGYEVNALRFVVKGSNDFGKKLAECLDYCRTVAEFNDNSAYIYQHGTSITQIPYRDILYFEAMRNYIIINTIDKKQYKERKTFTELQSTVPARFMLSTRSYLVNMQHVKAVTATDVILSDNTYIPLSRTYKHELTKAFLGKK